MPQPSDSMHAANTDDLLADAPTRPEETDDLLASMADEAIDRMLGGVPGPANDADAAVANDDEDALPDLSAAEAAALGDEPDAPEEPRPADVTEAVASDDDALDALFRGEDGAVPDRPAVTGEKAKVADSVPTAPQELPAAAAALAAELEADIEQRPPVREEPEVAADGDEDLDALLAGSFEDAPAADDEAPVADAAARPTRDGVPVYLKPLVWMNRPLDRSPAARDLVGKIALLTLLNAGGLLVYVALRG